MRRPSFHCLAKGVVVGEPWGYASHWRFSAAAKNWIVTVLLCNQRLHRFEDEAEAGEVSHNFRLSPRFLFNGD